jgi:hypothetical protein
LSAEAASASASIAAALASAAPPAVPALPVPGASAAGTSAAVAGAPAAAAPSAPSAGVASAGHGGLGDGRGLALGGAGVAVASAGGAAWPAGAVSSLATVLGRPSSSAWWRATGLGALAGGGLEDGLLVGLRLGDQHGRRRGQALEGLPVTGDLEDGGDRLGRLGADAQPVRGALAVDLDEGGFSFGWYLPIVSMTRPSRLVRASATTMR